jgi:hypothetical protein
MINNYKNFNENEKRRNMKLIREELRILKIEYEKELGKYKEASRSIIETEEKFNNISKKINKINYKQMILTNKISNDYVENLNTYKLEQNVKITLLSLLGFPFPNQEPFYFSSSEDLMAQLSLSKDFLFNLALTKKSDYDIIKSSYDNLDKRLLILRPIYDYMNMNFDIVNLMIKRENIFEENKNWVKYKDNALINVKILEKKIKEKYSNAKKRIKVNNINQKSQNEKNINNMETNKEENEKDFDELLNDSHLLSIKDFDDISGKSFMMSLNDDNSIMGIFNEEEINNFDIDNKKLNHKFYFNDQVQTFNQNTNKINTLMQGIKERNEQNQLNMLVKAPDTNTNIFTEEEEEKDIDNIINEKNKIIIKRYRSQFKDDKDKDILRIEKSVGDSGCCASCT